MADHDDALEAAVKAWCDAELLTDDDYSRATLVGEWHLVINRSGFDQDGDPISQTFIASSHDAPSRLLGLVREATMKLEHFLSSHF